MKSKSGPLQKLIDSYIEELYKLDSVIKVNKKLMRRANMNVSKTLFGKNPWLFKYNDNSHQQILFFEQLGLDPVSNKKDGTGKIDKSFLKKYSDVKEVSIFGELRKVKTLYNSFISSLFDILKNDPDCRGDLRLRSNYSPLTVLTSRLSSTDPNLQNIPAHGKQAHLVQRLIIPSLGNMFLKADFMAHEVRDWGNQSGDHAIANNFYKSLKLRQQLRYLCYNNPDEAIMWRKLKDSKEWFKITDPKQKEAILSSINNEATAKIAKIDFLLELYGDIHKLNVNIFYGTPVLEVSKEQRQNIKSVVFGTLYGKGAASLARDLKIEEQEAQEIIDTMFEKFSKGKEWIDKMHSNGAMDCFITSPLGMRRHLWGYLSSSYKVIGAMNRRGPNSAIQGAASNMGCAAVRELQSLIWKYFESNKFSLGGRSVINYVHDSLESEVKIDTMPIYVYLKEHALTTLVHRKMADIFDYNLLVGLETEFGFGPTMAHIEKWDYMADSLLHNIESTIKFQIDELKYKLPSNKILKVVEHNWNVVAKIRMKELKVSMKDKSPNRYMYLLDEGIKNPVEELDLRCI
jgi:DNA polymerase I-like protein with 3'-5' exonuclease and polymerase domains